MQMIAIWYGRYNLFFFRYRFLQLPSEYNYWLYTKRNLVNLHVYNASQTVKKKCMKPCSHGMSQRFINKCLSVYEILKIYLATYTTIV
jgi:hypothetical protein